MSAESVRRRKAAFADWMAVRDLNVNRVGKQAGVPVTTLYSYLDEGRHNSKSLSGEIEDKIARAFDLPAEAIFGPFADPGELPLDPNHVRAWREQAGLTVADLAQHLGVTQAIVSLLEDGRIVLSAKWMRRLAAIFGIKPAFIAIDPAQLDDALFDAVGVPPESQEHARQVLDTFRRPRRPTS